MVALVFYLLLAAILTFGHALYVAQSLHTAADLGAREIALTPLPPELTLDDPADAPIPGALHADDVRSRIFDEAYLVIDLQAFYGGGGTDVFQEAVPQMPLLNRQLVTVMIVDRPDYDGDGTPDAWLLRYPGALLERITPLSPPAGGTYPAWARPDLTVGIPVVTSRTPAESILWVPVVEEIDTESSPTGNEGSDPDPFQIDSPHRGVVALRVNYPFQSASMSAFEPNPAGPFEPTIGAPIAADDAAVTELNASDRPGNLIGGPLQAGELYAGTYGGAYGLGAQGALGSGLLTGGRPVRPFRRLLSAQAIYRREIFE